MEIHSDYNFTKKKAKHHLHFNKKIVSRNEDEKGVKDVYYMTHHVHVMCVYFSFENGQILIGLLF